MFVQWKRLRHIGLEQKLISSEHTGHASKNYILNLQNKTSKLSENTKDSSVKIFLLLQLSFHYCLL